MFHEAMPNDGATLPSGHHVPKGACMGANAFVLHHDDRFYFTLEEYDPLRFAEVHNNMAIVASEEVLPGNFPIYRKN